MNNKQSLSYTTSTWKRNYVLSIDFFSPDSSYRRFTISLSSLSFLDKEAYYRVMFDRKVNSIGEQILNVSRRGKKDDKGASSSSSSFFFFAAARSLTGSNLEDEEEFRAARSRNK